MPTKGVSRRMKEALPNLIIIGAMKSGTTSLHHQLSMHPDVQMSNPKELNFFHPGFNLGMRVEWYRSHFSASAQVRGESSPIYSKCTQYAGVPKRMHQCVPETRIIYIVRDPLNRIMSHYRHNVICRREERPIEQCFEDLDSNPYIDASSYHLQLTAFLEYFRMKQIHVLSTESLAKAPKDALARVFRFLDIDESPARAIPPQMRNRTADLRSERGFPPNAPDIHSWSQDLKDRVLERIAPDTCALRTLTGMRFEGWRI